VEITVYGKKNIPGVTKKKQGGIHPSRQKYKHNLEKKKKKTKISMRDTGERKGNCIKSQQKRNQGGGEVLRQREKRSNPCCSPKREVGGGKVGKTH